MSIAAQALIMMADIGHCFSVSRHLHRRGRLYIGSGCLPCHACDNIKGTHRELFLLSVTALLRSLYAHWPEPKGLTEKKANPASTPMSDAYRAPAVIKNILETTLSHGLHYNTHNTEIWLKVKKKKIGVGEKW